MTTTVKNSIPTILVTGAGGFIGGWIVESGHLRGLGNMRAGVRTWSSAARVARFPVEIALCDLHNQTQLAEAVKGVDAVIHCAYSDDARDIVDGTRNILEAAHQAGVGRVVYISSAEVYGSCSGDIDEHTQAGGDAQPLSAYGQAKRSAEQLCADYNGRGLSTVVLRPSVVYGPFGKIWTTRYAQRLASGDWGVFEGYGDGWCNLIYVDDLAQAAFTAVQQASAGGHTFNINNPERITWNQYFERFNAALGLPPLRHIALQQQRSRTSFIGSVEKGTHLVVDRFKDPLMKLYMRVGWANTLMKGVKATFNNTPSQAELQRLFSRQAYFLPSRARDGLGFVPSMPIDEGLRMSANWLRLQELVK